MEAFGVLPTEATLSRERLFLTAAFKNASKTFEYILVKKCDVRPNLDVLCERGGKGNRAPGNLFYRALGRCLVPICQVEELRNFVQAAFIEMLQASSVRFLEACYKKNGIFYPLPRHKKARDEMKDEKGRVVGKSHVSGMK